MNKQNNVKQNLKFIYKDINVWLVRDFNTDTIIDLYCLNHDSFVLNKTINLSINSDEIIVEYKIRKL